jgi:hypothetical protein
MAEDTLDLIFNDGAFTEALSELGTDNTSYTPDSTLSYRSDYSRAINLYESSALVQNAVEVIPTTAINTFEGWKIDGDGQQSSKLTERLYRWFERKVYTSLLDACHMGRLVGAAYLIVVSDDDTSPATPFRYNVKSRIHSVIAVPQQDLLRPVVALDPYYTLTQMTKYSADIAQIWDCSLGTIRIHPSRVVEIPGKRVSPTLRDNTFQDTPHLSILDSLVPALKGWIKANKSVIQMLETHSAFTLGISNLSIKSKDCNKKDGIVSRLKATILGIRTVKGLIYDKNTESAAFISRSYSGIDALLKSLNTYLDAASDTPFEFLVYGADAFGKQGGGGARQALAQRVSEYQRSHLRPALERLLFMYLCSIGDPDSLDDLTPVFGDGLILSTSEREISVFKKAQRDAILVNARIIRNNNERLQREWEETNSPPPEAEASQEESRNSLGNALSSQQGRSAYNGQNI